MTKGVRKIFVSFVNFTVKRGHMKETATSSISR